MDDFIARQLLQVAQRQTANGTFLTPNTPQESFKGFQLGIAVVMMMALGSCCLVTCCNCLRVGAVVMASYRQNDPDAEENEAHPAHGRITHRERPRVVQHEWDPNNPDDPVFLVQPDGGVGLAYQLPGTPSAKSVPLSPFSERPRRSPRERLAALRSCACMATPVEDDQEAQRPDGSGGVGDGANSLAITARPDDSRNRSRGGQSRSAPRSKTGSNKRDVEYCAINLDEAVLAQSLADTAEVLSKNGEEPHLAQHTAVAMLLEKDNTDDDNPTVKVASSEGHPQEQPKPDQPDQ